VRDCRRLESLGSDRNHSRYWLFQSHPEALFVEKMASPDIKTTECPDIGDVENENLKDGEIDPFSRYYRVSDLTSTTTTSHWLSTHLIG
jgi:hypothetical protein